MGSGVPIDVSILVVSHNTREMTIACLDSIRRETRGPTFEVIVVDNNSSDGSAVAIGEHATVTRLFALKENIGFARANNLAAAHARGRYILLLNPDTLVIERAIDRLYEFAQVRPEAMIWGGRTVFGDGRLNPASCWGRMTPWNLFCRAAGLTGLLKRTELFNGESYGGWRRDSVREVDIVSGCFLLLPRALWQQLGGFDEHFYMYGEEADLCLRARSQHGARPQITPAATIVHFGGASERTRTAKMVKLLAAKASLIERHWSPALRPIGLALLRMWPLSRWIANSVIFRVIGSQSAAQTAEAWREIWQARGNWRFGYQTSELPTAEPALTIPAAAA